MSSRKVIKESGKDFYLLLSKPMYVDKEQNSFLNIDYVAFFHPDWQ